MIQLGYYSTSQQQQDESIDFDPNYDPSDFLIKKDSSAQPEPLTLTQLPPYQESYEYASNLPEVVSGGEEMQQQPSYYGSFAQQSFNVNDFGFQQPQPMQQDDYSQSQPSQPQMMIPSDGAGLGLADLEISDSEDEDDTEMPGDMSGVEQPADTSKDDDDGLWF